MDQDKIKVGSVIRPLASKNEYYVVLTIDNSKIIPSYNCLVVYDDRPIVFPAYNKLQFHQCDLMGNGHMLLPVLNTFRDTFEVIKTNKHRIQVFESKNVPRPINETIIVTGKSGESYNGLWLKPHYNLQYVPSIFLSALENNYMEVPTSEELFAKLNEIWIKVNNARELILK